MPRNYRQLSPEERATADTIWWVQARDLDDALFYGEGAGLYAMFDLDNSGSGLGYFCAGCRSSVWKEQGAHTTPPCGCSAPQRIKLHSRAQAQHLASTPTLADRLAMETTKGE